MTRINLIPVKNLTKRHLIAEYREIPRVAYFIRKSMNANNGKINLNKIPKKFKFGEGHIYFFYDKGKYLYKRYEQIVNEMKSRGIKVDPRFEHYPKLPDFSLNREWYPSKDEVELSLDRIREKINNKPWLYSDKELTINMKLN